MIQLSYLLPISRFSTFAVSTESSFDMFSSSCDRVASFTELSIVNVLSGLNLYVSSNSLAPLEGDMEAAETAIGALEDGMEAAQGDIEDLQVVQETVSTGSSGTVTLANHETKVLSGTPRSEERRCRERV